MSKIGVTSLGLKGTVLPKAVAKMVQFGAECTELNGRPGCHPDVTWEKEADFATAGAVLSDASIVATSMGGYCDFAQMDDDALEAQIEGFVGYCQRPALLPTQFRHRAEAIGIVRAVGDYLAGMTDRFCEKQYFTHFAAPDEDGAGLSAEL